MGEKKYILVSEPISTGANYITDIIDRGYTPIAFFPYLTVHDEMYEEHCRKRCADAFPRETVIIYGDSDYDKVIEQLRKYNIVCVVIGSEAGVIIGDRIANDLNLLGNPTTFSAAHINKDIMQNVLKEAGIRHIKGEVVHSAREAEDFITRENLHKTVVKYLDGSASIGLHICSDMAQAIAAVELELAAVKRMGSESRLLVQEFIEGTEYVVNTVSSAGKHCITDVWRYKKVRIGAMGNAYDNVELVTRLSPDCHKMCRYALSAVEALGIKYGPTHGEYMLGDNGDVVLIELGARPMGGSMPVSFQDRIFGFHLTGLSLDSYLDPDKFNEFERQSYRPKCYANIKTLIATKSKKLSDLPVFNIMKNLNSVFRVSFDTMLETDAIGQTVDLDTSPGTMFLVNDSEMQLHYDLERIHDLEFKYDALLFGNGVSSDESEKTNLELLESVTAGFSEPILVFTDYAANDCKCAEYIVDFDGELPEVSAEVRTVIVHLHKFVNHTEDFMERFSDIVKRYGVSKVLISGGSCEMLPYGCRGAGAILGINGFALEMPRDSMPDILVGTRE